jgi:pimeloyl-ACP methyl ester carboxylesterase
MTPTESAPDSPRPDDAPQRLTRPDGSTIAYRRQPGKGPGVVFVHGFMSDMTGGKALRLDDWARRAGHAFVRFDQRGHGASDDQFEDGTIGAWADDLIQVLDHLTEGPQVIVGSSMGGWLMLLAALARPDRVAGLVGIAAAPDFTEDLMWREFDDAQRETLAREGVVRVPTDYGDAPYPITRALIEEGRDHLLLGGPIPLGCPVRLIQGMRDESVPWETANRLLERLESADVEVTFIKNGDHRLSEPYDLDRLERVLDGLLARLAD